MQCLLKKNRFLTCTITKILKVKKPCSTPSDTNILIQVGLIYTCWRNVYHAHLVNYSFSDVGLYIVQPWKIPRFLLVLIFAWYHPFFLYITHKQINIGILFILSGSTPILYVRMFKKDIINLILSIELKINIMWKYPML